MPIEGQEFADFAGFKRAMQDWAVNGDTKFVYRVKKCSGCMHPTIQQESVWLLVPFRMNSAKRASRLSRAGRMTGLLFFFCLI